jgi:protein SCO1/2
MSKKILWAGVLSLAVIAAAISLVILFAKPPGFNGTSYSEPYPTAPQIELTKSNGEIFRLSDQKGKIALLFIGYASCPDICPTTLAELNLVMEGPGNKTESVEVVFVSVDPEADTPEKIQKYVEHFNPEFVGLRVPVEGIQAS